MTYAEFNEQVPKLPCIWLPQWRWSDDFEPHRSGEQSTWFADISITTAHSVKLHITVNDEHELVFFSLNLSNGVDRVGYLICGLFPYLEKTQAGETNSIITAEADYESGDQQSELILNQFTARWMPYFRRSCWLSGCSIECTAHEKLEWAMWLEQREQDWAMWAEEAKVSEQEPSRGFSIGPLSDIAFGFSPLDWRRFIEKFRRKSH